MLRRRAIIDSILQDGSVRRQTDYYKNAATCFLCRDQTQQPRVVSRHRERERTKMALSDVPSRWRVQGALILTQVLFGIGSIVGKLGVDSFNPVLFALIREASAGPILMSIAIVRFLGQDGKSPTRGFAPRRNDMMMFVLAGFFIFVNQVGFIVGEKLANATIGSAYVSSPRSARVVCPLRTRSRWTTTNPSNRWQPTQPIMTAVMAMLLGWERPTWMKLAGILVSFGGAAFMVFYDGGGSTGKSPLAGNLLFFVNCAGTAGYVLISKVLMRGQRYLPLSVTAWSYIFASIFMVLTGVLVNAFEESVKFVCPPNDGETKASCSAWGVPTSAIGPLLYWILVQSVLCYFLLTWGNRYAKTSSTVAYTALQPLTSALGSVLLVVINGGKEFGGISMPGLNLLGGLGVVAGLFMVLRSDVLSNAGAKKADEDISTRPLVHSLTDANDCDEAQ